MARHVASSFAIHNTIRHDGSRQNTSRYSSTRFLVYMCTYFVVWIPKLVTLTVQCIFDQDNKLQNCVQLHIIKSRDRGKDFVLAIYIYCSVLYCCHSKAILDD